MNLKKLFRKNGLIMINSENATQYNYFVINNYLKIKDINKINIEYFKKKGYNYCLTL